MKKNRTVILLFSIAGILGLLLLSSVRTKLEFDDRLFSEKFLTQIDSIKLVKVGEEISVSKSQSAIHFGLEQNIAKGQWVVTRPSLTFPNIESLNRLLLIVSQLKPLNKFKSESLNEYGLASSSSRIELMVGNNKTNLIIGAVNPVSKRRYAMIEGGKEVLLLDDAEISSILKLEIREFKPFKIPFGSIAAFKVDGPSQLNFFRLNEAVVVGREYDRDLVELFLGELINLPALRTHSIEEQFGSEFAKLNFEWITANQVQKQSEADVYSTNWGSYIVKIPGSSVQYEYGSEFGRLISRNLESFYSRRLLKDIVLEDYLESCVDPDDASIKFQDNCHLADGVIENFTESFRRVEVLNLERLPGRLMTPTQPECRLKLKSSKTLFEIGEKVSGEEVSGESSPRNFIVDLGPKHFRGIISGVVAEDFCKIVEKLCIETIQTCAS